MRHRTSLLIALIVVCTLQALRVVVLDRMVPGMVRGGRPFVISGIDDPATISQRFAAERDGLGSLVVDGAADGTREGYVDAALFEVWNAGERAVRRATLDLHAEAARCCTFSFEPLENSRGREYRLELTTRDLGEGAGLSLRARPVAQEGGLTLNGRPQRANLVLTADRPLARMKGAPRVSLWFLIGCFAVIDAGATVMLYGLWSGAGGEAWRAGAGG